MHDVALKLCVFRYILLLCRVSTVTKKPDCCQGQSIDPALLTNEGHELEPRALMCVMPVPRCIRLPEEACLQDYTDGHVDSITIGDGDICEHCVTQSQIDLINQLFDAVASIPVGFHSGFVFLALHLVADSVSC